LPDVPEHRAVQVAEVLVVQQLLRRGRAAQHRRGDVALLRVQQVGARGYVGQAESLLLFLRERGIAFAICRQEVRGHGYRSGSAQGPRRSTNVRARSATWYAVSSSLTAWSSRRL